MTESNIPEYGTFFKRNKVFIAVLGKLGISVVPLDTISGAGLLVTKTELMSEVTLSTFLERLLNTSITDSVLCSKDRTSSLYNCISSMLTFSFIGFINVCNLAIFLLYSLIASIISLYNWISCSFSFAICSGISPSTPLI